MPNPNIVRHHREKPTDHPLRTWRKLQRPAISLAVLAGVLNCTRAHLSLIEHYRVAPGYWLSMRLWFLTGVPPDWMIHKAEADSERRRIKKQFNLALENHHTRKANRKGKAEIRQG